MAAQSDRPADTQGVALLPLKRTIDEAGYHYEFVDVADRSRVAPRNDHCQRAECGATARTSTSIVARGCRLVAAGDGARIDDAILMLRTNQIDIGTWLLKTRGDADAVLAVDARLTRHRAHWFVRETIGMLRRTLGAPRRVVAHDCSH